MAATPPGGHFSLKPPSGGLAAIFSGLAAESGDRHLL
jgi:hypothetical protein